MGDQQRERSPLAELLDHLQSGHSAVWVADGSDGWGKGTVLEHSSRKNKRTELTSITLRVQLAGGAKDFELHPSMAEGAMPVCPRNVTLADDLDDLVQLTCLNEPSVLNTIRQRYADDRIYTYSGLVLASVNPYCPLPHLYHRDAIEGYSGRQRGDLDPHVFAVAEEAYRSMLRDEQPQSIIISGESGAGKTVCARHIMRYFATVDRLHHEESKEDITAIEHRILSTNPILESFGNAKTTRNDNSSRFGKYLQLHFRRDEILGASIRTYLLEKTRVVTQAAAERNYHIFYQMLAAAGESELVSALAAGQRFRYLNPVAVAGVDDRREFDATVKAMRLTGFSEDDLRRIFRLLAGILHLGNATPRQSPDGESCFVEGCEEPARLLGLPADALQHWLTHRQLVTARETVVVPLKAEQSETVRDAVAKLLYTTLFNWIVDRLNQLLMPPSAPTSFIGVLDIYGFERFDDVVEGGSGNSFEQFCINYANERLQHEFTQQVFRCEQALYKQEAIQWSFINYADNQPCIDLIEGRTGIIALLDEILEHCAGSEHLVPAKFTNGTFTVRHFAYDVAYTVEGFLEKNRDSLPTELVALLRDSDSALVADHLIPLFTEAGHGSLLSSPVRPVPHARPAEAASSSKRGASIAASFKASLNSLMAIISSTHAHYVRCIKPNQEKAAHAFEAPFVLQQLRACGIIETIRISAAGYPTRWTFEDFVRRYWLLAPDSTGGDVVDRCTGLLASLELPADQHQLGRTRVFLRAGMLGRLEGLRTRRLNWAATTIQGRLRQLSTLAFVRQARACTLLLQDAARRSQARAQLVRHLMLAGVTRAQSALRGSRERRLLRAQLHGVVQVQTLSRSMATRSLHAECARLRAAAAIQHAFRLHKWAVASAAAVAGAAGVQRCLRRHLAWTERNVRRATANSTETLQEAIRELTARLAAAELLAEERLRELERIRASPPAAPKAGLPASRSPAAATPAPLVTPPPSLSTDETLAGMFHGDSLLSELRSWVETHKPEGGVLAPAAVLSLWVRYAYALMSREEAQRALARILLDVKESLKMAADDLKCAFWVSNLLHLSRALEYSAAEEGSEVPSRLIRDAGMHVLRTWLSELESWFAAASVTAVMQYQPLPGYVSGGGGANLLSLLRLGRQAQEDPRTGKVTGNPSMTTDVLADALQHLLQCLERCRLAPRQLLSGLFRTMAASCLNYLLAAPRQYATWKRGVQIQFNLSRIEDWCVRTQQPLLIASFAPVLQAAKLLQLAKSLTEADLPTIAEACPDLSILQIRRILAAYHPDQFDIGPVSEGLLDLLDRWRSDLAAAARQCDAPLENHEQQIKLADQLTMSTDLVVAEILPSTESALEIPRASTLLPVLPANLWKFVYLTQ